MSYYRRESNHVCQICVLDAIPPPKQHTQTLTQFAKAYWISIKKPKCRTKLHEGKSRASRDISKRISPDIRPPEYQSKSRIWPTNKRRIRRILILSHSAIRPNDKKLWVSKALPWHATFMFVDVSSKRPPITWIMLSAKLCCLRVESCLPRSCICCCCICILFVCSERQHGHKSQWWCYHLLEHPSDNRVHLSLIISAALKQTIKILYCAYRRGIQR